MTRFAEWCDCKYEVVNGHNLIVFVLLDDNFEKACESIAQILPSHYVSGERIAHLLKEFGKEMAADYLCKHLPQKQKGRSGDLGEILATLYIDEQTVYKTPIKRLRWKDHREMAMRGDDIIGIYLNDGDNPIKFLKSEAKSRAKLSSSVVKQARQALNNCEGLPTPHSLAFISDRLYEEGKYDLADLIITAQLMDGITEKNVQHLTFAFCGNKPDSFLEQDLKECSSSISQSAVGLFILKHQEFISKVFENASED